MTSRTVRRKRRDSLSIGAMHAKWRAAVYARRGRACILCGAPATQVHHIIHRSHSALLRFDVRNGAPLCAACHATAHTLAGLSALRDVIGDDWQYLAGLENQLKRDVMVREGVTDRDLRRRWKAALEAEICVDKSGGMA